VAGRSRPLGARVPGPAHGDRDRQGPVPDFDGTIVGGEEPSVSGSVRVASLDTLHDERDGHLRSPDFFDAERYPEIAFAAEGLERDGRDGRFVLPGELTIKGVTRPITLEGELRGSGLDTERKERVALALRGQLDRSEFGLVWNRVLETGGLLVGNAVELVLDLSAVRAD
jgi:polyisoprenoid-binding protein YceI